jgi:nucleoside-diphosphate-sugar epimerase
MSSSPRIQRRAFLGRAGGVVAGGAALGSRLAGPVATAEETANPTSTRKSVAIIPATGAVAQPVREALAAAYQVRTQEPLVRFDQSLEEWAAAKRAMGDSLRGCDAVVYAPEPAPDRDEAALDELTRGTYDLLNVAASQKVQLVVFLSTLELMSDYPNEFAVDEGFMPTTDTSVRRMSLYLAEFTCREFAREGKLRCITLRIGQLANAPASPAAAGPLSVTPGEVARAVKAALDVGFSQPSRLANWEIFHIQSSHPQSRSSTEKAILQLGWKPDQD